MAEQGDGTSYFDVSGLLREAHAGDGCAHLVVVSGSLAGLSIELTRPHTRIGRRKDNDLVLESDTVSREHARIEREGNHHFVVDVGSRNGVYLNGRRVESNQRCHLGHGDSLVLGDVLLLFRRPDRRYHGADLPPIEIERDKVYAEVDELLNRYLHGNDTARG